MRAVTVATFVLLLVPVSALAQLPCPLNYFSMGGSGGYIEDNSSEPAGNWYGHSYDHVAGTLQGGHTGSGEAGSFAGLMAQDRYSIFGPPSATPIAFQVRFHVTGFAGGGLATLPNQGSVCLGSQVQLRLADGALEDVATITSEPCGPRAFDEMLHLDLAKLPGEEFTLSAAESHSAGHSIQSSASGAITFVGLPPGYVVQSCNGYALAPVAVQARSWGQVKQLYR